MSDIEVVEIAAPGVVVLAYESPDLLEGAEVTAIFGGRPTGSVPLEDAPSIVTDVRQGDLFTVTLAGDRTLADPIGLGPLSDTRRLLWRIRQDGVGGHRLTLGPIFNVNPTVAGPIELSPQPGSVTYLGAVYDAEDEHLDVIAFGPRF